MQRKPVCVWHGGQLLTGLFTIDDQGTVIVTSRGRRMATQQGNSPAELVAKWLLRELGTE
jgi:hypothetical protein